MSLPEKSFLAVVDASLEVLDAEMSACAFLWRLTGPSLNRQEITPQRLIGYRVFSDYGNNLLGECGWLNLQYLDPNRASLWFQVTAPSDDDYDRYAQHYQFSLPLNVYEWSADAIRAHRKQQLDQLLSSNRHRLLVEICMSVLSRLPKPDLTATTSAQIDTKSSRLKGGRPGLPDDEKLRRLALVMLEKKLKQIDPGLTHGEFAFQVQQKLKIPLEEHTIRNAAKLLERAQKNDEQQLLSQAEALVAEWQSRFW